ncbi:hypothetical protein C8039_12200 [Halogeometricum sp. wsp3]|nr:hypothetical protein C8039_12200 [Halogeometricum sp. wsp3]
MVRAPQASQRIRTEEVTRFVFRGSKHHFPPGHRWLRVTLVAVGVRVGLTGFGFRSQTCSLRCARLARYRILGNHPLTDVREKIVPGGFEPRGLDLVKATS